MNKEWTDLKDLNDVAIAQKSGWEIEIDATGDNDWVAWGGTAWMNHQKYRGRPAQPKVKKVKLEAWLDSLKELRWFAGPIPFLTSWTRVPSEDKEIEVEA